MARSIVATDPNNITVDGVPLNEWVIAHEQDAVGKLRALREEHAAAMENLKAAHREALAERDAKIEAQATAYTQHHEETHRTVADWQAARDADVGKLKAEHEAALKDFADSRQTTIETLQVELEQARASLAEIGDALKELGDIPAVVGLARQRRADQLRAELERLEPQQDARRMMAAAPAATITGLHRADDGRIVKVIRQSDRGPAVIFYWPIDDVAHADSPIGKRMQRMTLTAWREAGFEPYDGG
jgi:chromosome segregation ATPase